MSRVRRGFKARRRRNRLLKLAKGFHFDRRTKVRQAATTICRALYFSYVGRKRLKREMRSTWIIRINAGARLLGSSYSKMMCAMKKNNCLINRKMLAEIAATDFNAFQAINTSLK
ncbi:MAG: 50S ribosomal protein L20 [Bdellovibrionales bacterium RIFOXYD12_FULL_39_22]|nr:MAG: 50S ribosomal protein L20 [Bdellovibrionales bacterium RIFOXYB1_FULL_39_21]OFZ42893.1 MAG: 50S ribosomal protein L20 [Bdellovibrionales bacterium RIFOXYC12_FULL_39_17]OFZ47447.1 MAG: 50S ribosomal protein L20 [Bdellovibrionales bacterium RIFOXYC1_FULL_39_130]OFZ75535.1 MAG: 50S ribosomal protein L20 [Bdellovibrionales bacterium RIFOXYD1_FULL_39_84]OFZ93858.1 MAG: 50S ribosomal protein L20 [Bdellovibrionales bacterium RIFOXYD12_FULL_39_22]HLE10137.1 50S ribosomal protein L20 [Bacteriovo